MKVVLITGASSGLGKSIGEYLLTKGHSVFGTSRNPSKYPDSKFPLIAMDVRDVSGINACVAEVISKTGGIDVLVNNAGVGILGPLEEIPTDEIRNHFEVNLYGPIEVMKAVLPQMRLQKSGQIINITSIAGYTGLPFRSVYSAGKGALELLSEGIRMEVKSFGIDISCLAPGEFATNIADGRYYAPQSAESAYAEVYGRTIDLINSQVNAGDDPILVAQAVSAIINQHKPKIHYKVGPFMSRLSIVLKRILPDKVYERILMNHYKL
ncbi:SDR family oxidoreductase [Flavobacterium silvaticum]|uniref:SDR family oxidoreductase n=1 Tax=Flavobacterium silvaticum TaxID=1852020 RepID=A0A972JIA6_9FLAO|nr:SDR family oxidoreductase [Flavobacterium silvaticum]NMH28800.1 SDR family oxidoreductase [Flavobacterium silvaticum]